MSPTYTVRDAAERSGFSADTLRYYEKIDLVTDVGRDAGGRRVYTEDHLAWLAMLRCLRDTGMPIQDMSHYAELSRDNDTSTDAGRATSVQQRLDLLRKHAQAVDAQLDLLTRQRAHLAEKIAYYESVSGTGETPTG